MNITIVGAGIVGCAIAHELASRGVAVRLVDERGAGLGATRASAGMLAPHIEGHLAPLLALSVRSLAMYDEFVRRAARDSGQTIEYERSGTLQVARTAAEAAALCESARALGGQVDHALLDANETRRMEPQLAADVVGSLHVRDHAYVAATALTLALAAAAARQGAAAVTARVTSIEGGETPRVLTSDGRFDADAVIIAAGTWSGHVSGQINAGSQAPIDVSRGVPSGSLHGHHTAVKPIRGQLLQLRLATRPASRVIWGDRCYLVPWRDGSVLAGATVEDVGFRKRNTVSAVRRLRREASRLAPTKVRLFSRGTM